MDFTIKSNLKSYSADSDKGRENIVALKKRYKKAFRRVEKELNTLGDKYSKLGYGFFSFIANPDECLLMPSTNITAEISELFAPFMADALCKMSLIYGTTPDDLIE